MMNRNIQIFRMDMCPKCKNVSLEIYDVWNNAMGYKNIIDAMQDGKPIPSGYLNKRGFYTIRCKSCGTCFPIIWEDGYPLPDSFPPNREIFLQAFKEGDGKRK